MTPGSRLHVVMRAVTSAGGRALTVREISDRAAFTDGGPVQVAPLVHWLQVQGYLALVGPAAWPRWTTPRYRRFFDV